MTIRKIVSQTPQRGLVVGALMLSLTGCGMVQSVVGDSKVDYKSAKKASTLDVPPDLTQLSKDNRYSLPSNDRGVATASGYQAARGTTPGAAPASTNEVATTGNGAVRVERAGNQRWLVVQQTPEALWPQLKSFWEESGFNLAVENSTAGVMETEWNENRAKIPQDFIRNTIGKVFDGLYSSGERDKYRTRLERNPAGGTEIYISHRGTQEVASGPQNESTMWTNRNSDPNLEAIFLAKLMAKLGGSPDETTARTSVDNAAVQAQHATLMGEGAGRFIKTDEGFDRTWRRVGLALDRAGFTVEDRDRVQGVYYVRFVNDATDTRGWFSRLFSSSDKDKEAQRYRISVRSDSVNSTQVSVWTNKDTPDETPVGEKILTLLHEQLK
ncbi:outer membrane protein assembly factor BamC [Pseudoduganella violaceinigra]|uniref:outer membrane protein assembly factor BamC n=1 Tax=Pseudoduganella violaceinigra TaxID=246602 RepID=UPI0006879741|nr:outer membrane protein assembly factor BamC [Pseudoduganella violaceinigra]